MAQFEITVIKDLNNSGGETWSNNYNVLADNILDAADYAQDIATIESAVLWDNVTIIGLKVEPVSGGGGYVRNVQIPGLRADGDPAVQLPLFNTVLVGFNPTIGRQSLKYLRLPLVEAEVTGFNVTEDHITFLNTNYAAPLIDLGVICNQQGSLVFEAIFRRPVQMRQLSWHRRSRPGFHRGYVPD